MDNVCKSRISFKQINKTEVEILQDGIVVGKIWSYLQKQGDYPYKNGYTKKDGELNGLQICGFQNFSIVWDCGMFNDTKDVVVDFNKIKL
jgi:hypothetical protein